MSYSYFSSPDGESLPKKSSMDHEHHNKFVQLRHENTRLSYPDVVTYAPKRSISHIYSTPSLVDSEGGWMLREEWVTDASYGYFTCPSMIPEPSVHKEEQPVMQSKMRANNTTPRRYSSDDYDGYSFFGI
jgi:hypothetical protein